MRFYVEDLKNKFQTLN